MEQKEKDAFFACPRCENTINYFIERVRPSSKRRCKHCQHPLKFRLCGTVMLYWFGPYLMVALAGAKHLGETGQAVLLSVAFYLLITLSIRVTIDEDS